jgi:hypothetical protein
MTIPREARIGFFKDVFSNAEGAKKADADEGVKAALTDRQTNCRHEECGRSATSASVARDCDEARFDHGRIETPVRRSAVRVCEYSAGSAEEKE